MAAARESDEHKKLRIQHGVCARCEARQRARGRALPRATPGRLLKELGSYRKEIEKQQERIAKLQADGADEHDVRKQVHADCVPTCAPRRDR